MSINKNIQISRQISVYFQNIDGFIKNRSLFQNSVLSSSYDLYLFQESNLHSCKHDLWNNMDYCDLNCLNLTNTDSGKWCRGMLLA